MGRISWPPTLNDRFGDVEFKAASGLELASIDGYLRLMRNGTSRLGWRILLAVHRPPDWEEMVLTALTAGEELAALVPQPFRAEHLRIAEILNRMTYEQPSPEDVTDAIVATNLSLNDLLTSLGIRSDDGDQEVKEVATSSPIDEEPKILVTSLMGAKGLQAEHVFIVGVNDGHFPRSNQAPTEDEVCQLLVAVTRARKSCTLISARMGFGKWLGESLFVEWLSPLCVKLLVDKSYFGAP